MIGGHRPVTSNGLADYEEMAASAVWKFNTTEETLVRLSSMPTARFDFGQAVAGHKVWCIGGMTKFYLNADTLNNYAQVEYTNEVEIYDTILNTWNTFTPNLPVTASATAVYWGARVWVFALDNIYEFNTLANVWDVHVGVLHHNLDRRTAVIVGDNVYLVGGENNNNSGVGPPFGNVNNPKSQNAFEIINMNSLTSISVGLPMGVYGYPDWQVKYTSPVVYEQGGILHMVGSHRSLKEDLWDQIRDAGEIRSEYHIQRYELASGTFIDEMPINIKYTDDYPAALGHTSYGYYGVGGARFEINGMAYNVPGGVTQYMNSTSHGTSLSGYGGSKIRTSSLTGISSLRIYGTAHAIR